MADDPVDEMKEEPGEPTEKQKEAVKDVLKPKEEKPEPEPDKAAPSNSPIDESKGILREMKEQNKVMQENLRRVEKLAAEELLGGRSNAGKETSEEDKEIEAARSLIAGTGFEDRVFPKANTPKN